MLRTDLRILIVDTGRVWWRLLPVIMGVYLLGWLGSELTLRVAVIAGDISAWLALALFAFSFVCTLVAAIVILTLAGRELGISRLLPEDEREIDNRDTSLTHLLAITLLPFLGMYAAFGQVAEAAQRLATQQFVRYGFVSDQETVLDALYDLATNHLLWLVALLVGIYVLRRLLDYVADRTGLRILGLFVVLIEAFFMLLVIMGGIRVFQTLQNWVGDRAVMQWLAEIKDAAARFFAIFKIDLPEILTRAWAFCTDQVGLLAGRSTLADHHELPVGRAVEVLLALCGRLGEAELVRAGCDQGAGRRRSEEISSSLEAAESPDSHAHQHQREQDRAVHQRGRNGFAAHRVRAARTAIGRRPVGIDRARIANCDILRRLSWGPLHRLSVGSGGGVRPGIALQSGV